MCVHGKEKARCTEGCAPLCGSVPAHEEKALQGAALQATKAFAELRRGQCITKLTELALWALILHLTKKPRGKHSSKDTMIVTLRGFVEVRDAIATGERANEKAASAAATEAVRRAVDGQPAGEEENARVPGGERGRKRRSAAVAGDDTEDSGGKSTERSGGGGGSHGRGVRAPRGAAQAGRGVIQESITDGLVEATAEATGAAAAPAMISVSLWQHELPIEDEGGDDNVGRGDDNDSNGGDNDGVEATPRKPAPQNSADRPPYPKSTLNPDLDTELRMSSENTIGDDAVEAEGGGLADSAICLALRQEEEGEGIVEAAEESEGGRAGPERFTQAVRGISIEELIAEQPDDVEAVMMLIDDSLWPTLLVPNA